MPPRTSCTHNASTRARSISSHAPQHSIRAVSSIRNESLHGRFTTVNQTFRRTTFDAYTSPAA
jgi:hypothetical protein